MENLTLAEINQLIADAGSDIVVDSAVFKQVNASNEAQYEVTHGGKTNHAFVTNNNGTYHINIETLGDNDPVVDPIDVAE